MALHDLEYAIATVTCEYISSDVENCLSALGTQIDLQNHLDFYLHLFQKDCWLSPPREILPAVYQFLLMTASQLLICPLCEQQ